MSDKPVKTEPSYLPVRDQAMPVYRYPAVAQNGSVTACNADRSTGTKPSVTVNGHLAY